MTTNKSARANDADLPKISDLHTDAIFLTSLAQAADILQYEADHDPRARNALGGVIEAIESKARQLSEDMERITEQTAA